MLRKIVKLTSVFLSVVFLLSLFPYAANADSVKQYSDEQCIANILDEYHAKTRLVQRSENASTYSATGHNSDMLRRETVKALQDAGYAAYDVTKETFDQVEQVLSTDLSEIGLSKDYSYIIVLSGEEISNGLTRDAYGGTPTPSFKYTYNGTEYTLRYMSVTAANVPAYGMASDENLLNSNVQNVINNCLNTAITAYLDAVAKPFGTVASLLGFDISNFAPEKTATLTLTAGTNWTRIFTQVQDPYYGDWIYGSSVEYVNATCFLSGTYYDADENRYVQIPDNETVKKGYSERFYDYEWRKETAIDNLFGRATYDCINKVKYYYGGNHIITHELNYY